MGGVWIVVRLELSVWVRTRKGATDDEAMVR